MDHALQVELARAILAHLDAGTTARADAVAINPVESYTSPRRLEREQALLFGRYPLLMGLSCQLAAPRAYLTDDHAGRPLLIVRGADGAVRAFLNVCRHRGARVAERAGTVRRGFSCPYHGWTYDTEGRLVGIPDAASFTGVEKAAHGLVPLPALERDGMIWVSPGAREIDLEGHLAGLGPELASYRLADYHHYETRVLRQRMNWKLVIDTFLEPYHFPVLHRDTVAPIFFPNLCLFHPFGPNLRETLPRQSIVELRGRPESEWDLVEHSAIVYVLFPNTVFVMQGDHVETWRVYPANGRVDECVMYLDFYTPEPAESDSARRHWDRNMDLAVRTVVEEDFPTGEGIQAGFAAGAQDHVTYGRNEPALAHYERMVAAAVAG